MMLRWIERGCYAGGALLAIGSGAASSVGMVLGFALAGAGLLLLALFLTKDRQACERIERMERRLGGR